MSAYFITATGTGIGKTFVTAALIHQWRAAGVDARALKPVVTGFGTEPLEMSDTGILLDAMGVAPGDAAVDAISPFRFAAPLAPAMAAPLEGRALGMTALTAFCRRAMAGPQDVLLVEGVGGVMVPMTGRETVLDWMAALGLPVILVAGSYLGTLSHTLSALEVLRTRSLPCAGVIVSETPLSTVDLADTVSQLEVFAGLAPVIALPRAAHWRDAVTLTQHFAPIIRPNRH